MSDKHFVGRDLTGFEDNGKTRPISRVTLMIDNENGVTAGDDSGLEITASCPHATQEMADAILARMKDYRYQMYSASAVNIDPAAELGDGITAEGVYGVISRLTDDGGGYPDVTGPGEAELEDEYPSGEGPMTREFNRKLGSAYSRITKTATEIRAEIVNEVEGLTSSFDLKLSGLEAAFNDEMAGLSSEFSAGLDGLSYRLEQVATDAAEDLAEYAEQITKLTDNLQAQIDGSITTWFYDYEPTANNEPASLWDTDDEKMKHLGDVFYIVDNAEKGGQAYRWEYVGGEYRWSLIEDVEVAKALADAANAQDTADKKRRVFTSQPTPPYDVGDLWSQGPTGELMRCTTARSSGSYVAGDWERASKYTDDSALTTFLNGDYKKDLENLRSQADQKAETWYQSADPSTAWTSTDLKNEHIGDMWYCTNPDDATHYQKSWRWSGSTWEEMKTTPPQTVFDRIDGKAQIFIAEPKPPYRKGDLWFNSSTSDIMTCVKERLTGSYSSGDWEKRNKYTDDTTANTAISRTVELAADLEKITARVTSTETTTGELSKSAIISSVEQFYQSNSATSLTGGQWADKQPGWVQGKFIWTRRLITYGDKHQAYSPSETGVCITGNTGAAGAPGSPGAPGKDGDPGSDGRGIKTITNHYLASPQSSGITKDSPGWTTAIQTISASKKYLWNYEVIAYDDGSSMATVPVIIGTFGTNGSNGTNGVGISSIDEHYLASSKSSGVTVSTPGWTASIQNTTTEKRYLWNYETINFTDNSHSDHAPRIIGTHGATGSPGSPGQNGVGVSEIEPEYYLSTSASSTVGGTWGTTVPEVKDGTYLWTRDKITYTDGSVEYTKPWNMTTPMLGSINSVVERVSELEIADENITARVKSTEDSVKTLTDKTAELELRDDSITAEVRETRTTVEDILYCNGRNLVIDSDVTIALDLTEPTSTLNLSEPLKAGGQYSFRIWYRLVNAGTDASATLGVRNTSSNLLGRFNLAVNQKQESPSISFKVNTTSSSTNLRNLTLEFLLVKGDRAATVIIDRVKLEEGEYSTDWSPAPEDDPEWTPSTTIVEKFSKLSQTVEGFTFEDEAGKVWINNGSINLTGSITFEDLDEDTQKRVGDGLTQEIVHTLIEDDLVQSPRIEGADIYGGTYHDSKGLGDLELTWSGAQDYPSLMFKSASTNYPIFNVLYVEASLLGKIVSGAAMSLGGKTILSVNSNSDTVEAAGNWHFGGLVSGISALSLTEAAETPAQAAGDGALVGPEFEGAVIPEKAAAKVDIAQSGGELKISLPGGTDWYLGPDGWHK